MFKQLPQTIEVHAKRAADTSWIAERIFVGNGAKDTADALTDRLALAGMPVQLSSVNKPIVMLEAHLNPIGYNLIGTVAQNLAVIPQQGTIQPFEQIFIYLLTRQVTSLPLTIHLYEYLDLNHNVEDVWMVRAIEHDIISVKNDAIRVLLATQGITPPYEGQQAEKVAKPLIALGYRLLNTYTEKQYIDAETHIMFPIEVRNLYVLEQAIAPGFVSG